MKIFTDLTQVLLLIYRCSKVLCYAMKLSPIIFSYYTEFFSVFEKFTTKVVSDFQIIKNLYLHNLKLYF
jgi:hypothetical protein